MTKDMCQIYETVTIFSATVLKIEKGPQFILNKEVFFNFGEMNIPDTIICRKLTVVIQSGFRLRMITSINMVTIFYMIKYLIEVQTSPYVINYVTVSLSAFQNQRPTDAILTIL